jgi:hypothetical protein
MMPMATKCTDCGDPTTRADAAGRCRYCARHRLDVRSRLAPARRALVTLRALPVGGTRSIGGARVTRMDADRYLLRRGAARWALNGCALAARIALAPVACK